MTRSPLGFGDRVNISLAKGDDDATTNQQPSIGEEENEIGTERDHKAKKDEQG